MTISTVKHPVGTYMQLMSGEWVYAIKIVDASEVADVTVQTGPFTGKYIQLTDDSWALAAALVDENGDALDISDAHITALSKAATTYSGHLTTLDETIAASTAVTANTVYLAEIPIALRSGPYEDAEHVVGATTSGNLAVGLYTYDGTTFTRRANSGITAAGTANLRQRVSFLSPYDPARDVSLYAGFAATAAITVYLRAMATAAGDLGRGFMKASSWDATDGLPATITGATGADKVIMQVVR